jgi:hypothetical protein
MLACFDPYLICRKKLGLRPLLMFLLPGVILIAAILFDRSRVLNFSIISVACVFSLVIFSFLLPSRLMIGWTIIYILAIAATLWMRRGLWTGSIGNADALVATRALVAAAAGVLACMLAKRREQGRVIIREINRLLDQMEIPVITSDRDGWLLHMNPKASQLLGGKASLGSPFFDHFSMFSTKGKSIKSYVDLATGVTEGPVSISLALGPDRSHIYPAIMLSVSIGDRGQVMTLLYPENSVPTSISSAGE